MSRKCNYIQILLGYNCLPFVTIAFIFVYMDHIKQLELDMLIKFMELGGTIKSEDFEKIFPDNTPAWRAVLEGLEKGGYTSQSYHSLQNNNTGLSFVLLGKGRLRIPQLEQEKMVLKKAEKDSGAVTNWTKIVGISTLIILAATLFLIYLAYHPPLLNKQMITDSHTLHHFNSIPRDTVIVTSPDGKIITYPNTPPPPPPPMNRKAESSTKRTDTLNVNDLPILQKEIEKNTKKSIK